MFFSGDDSFYDPVFDLNNDGKEDAFEEAVEMQYFFEVFSDDKKKEKEKKNNGWFF